MTTETTVKNKQADELMNGIDFDDDTLVHLSLFDQSRQSAQNIRIALISDKNELRKLNYYLFKDVQGVDYYTFDDEAVELDLIAEMDIVIFSKNDEKLKEAILHEIKAKNLKTKFMMISDKPYLRQKDILQEHINGVDKLMKMDFFLEDYILSIEKYLHSNFYSRRVLSIEDLSEVITHDRARFQQRVDELMRNKIYFSLLRYSYESEIDIDEYNIKKIVREHDTILIDKEKGEIVFLLMNVIPQFGTQIIKKRIENFSIRLSLEHACNVFDLLFEEGDDLTA